MGLYGTRQPEPVLSQTALRPAAIPSSTFERAPEDESAKAAAKNLDALARALGTLNGSVNDYANVSERIRQDPESKANREWIARRSQMSYDELRKEAESNTADGIRVREDAVTSLLGDKAYSQFRNDWAQYYETEFDHQNGDLTSEYNQKRAEFAQNLPDNISRGRFYQLTQNHFSAWQAENTREKIADAEQQVQTAVLDNFRNTIADGKNAGKSPEEIAQQLFEASAGNRSFLKFSGQQQNDTLFQVATEAAQNGDLGLVRALVETPRIGAKGEKIPPLKNIAAFASKSLSLIEKAQNSKLVKNTEENTKAYISLNEKVANGTLTDADAIDAQKIGLWTSQQAASYHQQSKNNLARIEAAAEKAQQKFEAKNIHLRAQDEVVTSTLNAMDRISGASYIGDAEIPNAAGTGTITIDRKKRIEMAVEAKEAQFDAYTQKLIDSGQSPEEAKQNADKVRLAWYANNNVENKTWTDMFNGAASRMTAETLTKNPDTTKVLTQQLETYHNLKQNNPAYLEKFVTDKKSKEFLEFFDNSVVYGQLPVHDAAIAAANWVAKDDMEKSKAIISNKTLERTTTSILKSQHLDKDISLNYSLVRNMVEMQSRLGVPEGRISDVVSQQLKNDTASINGVFVKKTKELPSDFVPLMLKSLDEISNKIPTAKGKISSSDMIILASPNEGMWSVHQKSNPMRVLAVITPQTLENIRMRDIHERENLLREKVALKNADADYIKSQLPKLEARRANYVNGEKATIERLRRMSKTQGDQYDRLATDFEKNLEDWIANDNAAALRGHKIYTTVTDFAKNHIKFNVAPPKSTSVPKNNNSNPTSIIGLYGEEN